jgi:hypothetical protein
MRRFHESLTFATALAFALLGGAAADDEEETSKLAPEATLCLKLSKSDVIRGDRADPYIELLSDGDVEGWNKRRKKDGGKVLDLAAKTWDGKGRDDLVLKLEGQDWKNADFSGVIFMPGTSFAFSNLEGAVFKGACIEGVKFSSIWSFEERTEKQVRSTCLEKTDFRDAVWTWCSALERTARRVSGEKKKETPENKQKRIMAEQQRLMEQLRRVQMGGDQGPDPFAFCEIEGVLVDPDAPVRIASQDEDADANNNGPQRRTWKLVDRLVRAVRADTLESSIDKLVARRHTAKTRECANPLKAEPALAAAIAATSSAWKGIETWKAVNIVEPLGRGEEATLVGGDDTVLVIDNPRTVAMTPLLICRGPVIAWRQGVLPLTFSAGPIVLKDQAYATGVIHGRPVIALSEKVRGDRRVQVENAGTFHSVVITEVANVENLSEAEAEKRALQDAKLKDYAQSQGDLWEGAKFLDPTKDDEGTEPEKALTEDVRKAIESEIGKDALDDMKCYKLSGTATRDYHGVLSTSKKAILIITASYQSHGPIYCEGPIVILGGKQRNWLHKVVTKSWAAVKGEPRVGQFVMLGKKVDVETKKDE